MFWCNWDTNSHSTPFPKDATVYTVEILPHGNKKLFTLGNQYIGCWWLGGGINSGLRSHNIDQTENVWWWTTHYEHMRKDKLLSSNANRMISLSYTLAYDKQIDWKVCHSEGDGCHSGRSVWHDCRRISIHPLYSMTGGYKPISSRARPHQRFFHRNSNLMSLFVVLSTMWDSGFCKTVHMTRRM